MRLKVQNILGILVLVNLEHIKIYGYHSFSWIKLEEIEAVHPTVVYQLDIVSPAFRWDRKRQYEERDRKINQINDRVCFREEFVCLCISLGLDLPAVVVPVVLRVLLRVRMELICA